MSVSLKVSWFIRFSFLNVERRIFIIYRMFWVKKKHIERSKSVNIVDKNLKK